MFKLLSNRLTLIGLGLCALAAWQYVLSLDKPGAVVDPKALDSREIGLEAPTTVTVEIRNESWHSVRVVGLGTC